MEPKEAIDTLRALSAAVEWDFPLDYAAAIDEAIEALEKQVPKKPTVPVDTWLCPSCGESVEYQQKLGDNVLYHGQHDFCPNCGQGICWEGE